MTVSSTGVRNYGSGEGTGGEIQRMYRWGVESEIPGDTGASIIIRTQLRYNREPSLLYVQSNDRNVFRSIVYPSRISISL